MAEVVKTEMNSVTQPIESQAEPAVSESAAAAPPGLAKQGKSTFTVARQTEHILSCCLHHLSSQFIAWG